MVYYLLLYIIITLRYKILLKGIMVRMVRMFQYRILLFIYGYYYLYDIYLKIIIYQT